MRPFALLALVVLVTFALPLRTAVAGGARTGLARSTIAADGQSDAALVVAIEDYAHLPPLPGARLDGIDWSTFFTEDKQIPGPHVHSVQDRAATREAVLAEAAKAASEVGPGGTLFVVFIGHGAPAQDGSEGVLVTADTAPSEESLYQQGVAQHELAQAMATGAAAHRVLLVEACFSGRTAGGRVLVPGFHPLAFRPAPPSGLTLLSAGDADEVAGPLPRVARSAFSYLVLGALRGWAHPEGGPVTAREVVGYARKMLARLPLARRQTPSVSGVDLDVPLATGGTERGPEPADLSPPPPPPLLPVTNRELLLPTAPAPPDAVLAYFEGSARDWQVVNDADGQRAVCTLPCSRWVPRSAKLAYVESRPGGRGFPVDVASAAPGAHVRFRLGSNALGKVLLVAGGVAATVGAGALWVYAVDRSVALSDGGQGLVYLSILGPVAVGAGFALPGGTHLSRDIVSAPNASDPATRVASRRPERPQVRFTGNGFAGTF